jgi:anti-sigma regulatory factor (Ser/Thr protein kinase)
VQSAVTFRPADRQKLADELIRFATDHRLPSSLINAADLCLEEHITNIINHGYESPAEHEIIVRLTVQAEQFQVEVEDDGKAFNPLNAPEVDTSVPMECKPIGGLGIHLIRRFMDDLEYRREGNKNILTMRKRLTDE